MFVDFFYKLKKIIEKRIYRLITEAEIIFKAILFSIIIKLKKTFPVGEIVR